MINMNHFFDFHKCKCRYRTFTLINFDDTGITGYIDVR